ncbi:uncharacterized protein LOC106638832 [Copidosoma floridanum]|uniref:uncharacterized protein LOC106638832 n=1 Tax=Copidosoma floridanum TaxID=29053 RepID=UPI0006C946FF|nr:uncharacterized protein LOC106638832 [Copidosoma floridanum]
MDRFSCWVEVVPIKDIQATTVLCTFQEALVIRFGAPRFIATDQRSQFKCAIFKAYFSFAGCQRKRTVPYHPAANDLIERWHCSFKAALMCHNSPNWVKLLPIVLLGLHTAVRSDRGASPAEFLYGTILRFPGEYFVPHDFFANPRIFIENYRQHMRELKPTPVEHHH